MAPRNTRVTPEVDTRSAARSFAQVLDNFYAPARDRRSEQAFQEGVAGFAGILQEKANRLKAEQREGEFQQGVADAMREEAGQELIGVKTGSLFRQHSSYYMAGLNETRGRAAASRFRDQTAAEYQNWDGRFQDDDGSAFREWMNGQVANFMGTLGEDQHRLAGAIPIINEVARNYATQHTAFTNQRLQEESMEAYDDIVSGVFSQVASGEFDMEMAIDAIAFEADAMYQTDGAEANNRVVAAAIRHANIHNDPTAILVMGRAHDAGKLRLSQVNRERLADALDQVEADIERNAAREAARDADAVKARGRELQEQWFTQLQQDPYTDITEWSAQNGVEGMFFKDLESLQSAMIRGREVENPTIANTQRLRLEAELHDAATASVRLRILSDFTAANPTALSGADVSRYAEGIFAEANPGSLINDPTIKQFRQSFGDTLAEFQLGAGFDSNKLSYLRTQGIRLFNEYLLRGAGNVDMNDPVAVSEFVVKVEDLVVRDLTRMFPDTMVKKLGEGEAGPALGVQLGVPEALQSRQAEIDAQAAAEFEELAGVKNQANPEDAPTDTPEDAPTDTPEDAPTDTPEVEDVPIEEQTPPFEDPDSEEPYPPTREGFYGELIQRFTDGVDSRSSTQSYQSAIEVWNEDPEFASEVARVANKFGVNPAMLMAIMDFETGGTYSTSVRNAAGSGATGLIQFMPNTARALGTTTEELAQMTRAEQMTYVEKYFDQFGSRIRGGNINDLYMAVLYPRAIGREDGYVLFREGTTAYQQNAGLDTNEDGTITKFEAAAKVRQRFTG